MRVVAAVGDTRAAMVMLGVPDRGVGDGSVRLHELRQRYARRCAPEVVGTSEIEALMEVQLYPEPCFVHDEERTEPGAEELNHPDVTVRAPALPIGLRSLTGVEGGTGDEELLVGELADPGA